MNSNHADLKKKWNKQSLELRRGFYLQWIIGEGASRLQPIRHSLAGYADADTAAPVNLSKEENGMKTAPEANSRILSKNNKRETKKTGTLQEFIPAVAGEEAGIHPP